MIGGVRSLVLGALAVFVAPIAASASSIFDDSHCEERLVLCLDPNGGFHSDESKTDLRVGERVHVIVIGVRIDDVEVTIDVKGVNNGNSLLPRPALEAERRNKFINYGAKPEKLAEKLVDIPNTDKLTIYIVQKLKTGESHIGSVPLQISDTLYFARAGLVFTWVDRGSRMITAEYSAVEKTDFFPGVALTIWPWGHRGRALSAFERPTKNKVARALGDAFALQVGTDFDFSKPFDRATFGLAFEPISGIGISAGIAVTTGQFFSGAPPGSPMAIVEHRMVRPYVSLALTSELFDTIKSLAGGKTEQKD